jgi:RimJ/RimL family protein N-acetyltransferase
MYQKIGKYILRDWKIEDASSIAKYANNRKIWQNLRDSFPHPYTMKDAEAFITKVNKSKPRTVFAITTNYEAIGSIGLILGNDVHQFTAEMGYFLAEPFWGKGIMTQAVCFLSAWAISNLCLQRISAEPYATNIASHKVLEKAGFAYEGRLRSSVFKDGKVLDQMVYSYLGHEGTQHHTVADHQGGEALVA